jgi:hypothetical protein
MRVTTELWVSALVRRVFAAGQFAAILRRGAAEAGAVFLVLPDRFGEKVLFGPAPQTAYEEGQADRRFSEILRAPDEQALASRLEREIRFDPDAWIVELEVGQASPETYFPVTKP